MHILVTNDDGISAPGLQALVRILADMGDVSVVAPDGERSASGHSISLNRSLRLDPCGERQYSCSGTPTDCVYLALNHLLRDNPPDLLVSGINHGPNLGNDLTYSGTVGAAMEGCLLGVPSIAISSLDPRTEAFTAAAELAGELGKALLDRPLPSGVFLNVNVPNGWADLPRAERGWAVATLGRRDYGNVVVEKTDPRGRPYYWIGGPPGRHSDIPGSDCNAMDEKLASVTPVHLDLAHYDTLDTLRSWQIAHPQRLP